MAAGAAKATNSAKNVSVRANWTISNFAHEGERMRSPSVRLLSLCGVGARQFGRKSVGHQNVRRVRRIAPLIILDRLRISDQDVQLARRGKLLRRQHEM